MGILGWILLGLIAGAIARLIFQGEHEPTGLLGTFGVGILGALFGGLVASALGIGSISSFFSIGTWLIAIAGALVLLAIYNSVTGASRGARQA